MVASGSWLSYTTACQVTPIVENRFEDPQISKAHDLAERASNSEAAADQRARGSGVKLYHAILPVHPLGTLFPFDKRLQIFAQGSKPEEVFLLERGIVKLAYTLPNGSTELLCLRYPGQFVEECAYVLGIPYPISAFTITPCHLYRIEARQMLETMRQNAEFANFIVHLQDVDLYNTAVALVEMKTLRPHERLDRFFWDLGAVIGDRRADGSIHLILPLSDNEIGQLLGFSVVHLKRSRKQLEDMGRLRHEGHRGIILFEH